MVLSPAEPEVEPVAFRGRVAARATRWSGLGVLVRQASQIGFALVVARLLGPAEFGLVSAATVYATAATLLLDQGLSAALVQRRALAPGAPGAVATLNLVVAIALAALTWSAAPVLAGFFGAPELVPVLQVLGAGLLLKAVAVTPRALLSRGLRFGAVAAGDASGALVGAAAGVTAALLGAGYASVVVQVLVTDAVVAAVLLTAARGPVPNLRWSALRPLLPFSGRVFASSGVAYLSRNLDNVLVGRFLGLAALAQYAMAYRVLVVPVQLLGQTVRRVLFPAFSRMADDPREVARTLLVATEVLALATVPVMALVACAAPEAVALVLGPPWAATAPLVSVLALAGARETVFYITPALMTAMGRASANLRFELCSTAVQVTGIVVGLRFGVLGVAVGYAVAGLAMTPVLLAVQRRLTGVPLRRQLAALWPAVHASAWGSAGYLLWSAGDLPAGVVLLAGSATHLLLVAAVLAVAHRPAASRALRRLRAVVR